MLKFISIITAVAFTMLVLVFYMFHKRGFSDIINSYALGGLIGYTILMIMNIGTAIAIPDLVFLLLINSAMTFISFKLSFQEYKLKKQYRFTKSLK